MRYTRWFVQSRLETDEALALRAQKGDEAATEELLLRYKNAVRALARRYFLAGGETEDLVQEGMVGLYLAICNYRSDAEKSFKNFSRLCVTRRIYDVLRSTTKKGAPASDAVTLFDPQDTDFSDNAASPEDWLLNTERDAEFKMKLLKELSDFEFRVVTMYLDGMSYAQICEATGKQMKSIDNALARSKRKLQQAFETK